MPVHARILAVVTLICAVVPSARARAGNDLLELIPDDAVVALYVERPQKALPPKLIEPLLEALIHDQVRSGLFAAAIKRIPGPVIIGLIMPPPGKEEPDVFVALDLSGPPMNVDELVEKTLLPALEGLGDPQPFGKLKVEKGKTATRVLEEPGGDAVFAYAVKDKVAFGCSRPQLAQRWAQGQWPPGRWVAQPGVRKMLGRLPKQFAARVFFNPAPLLERYAKPSPNSVEELALKVFAPEDVRAAAMDLNWGPASLSARITIALADECHGLGRVLARPANSARVLGVFPRDFVALARLGWGSASDVADGAYAICDRFDESIAAEYREELAEFESETGVDWDSGFLGNLVGELAVGIRVDFARRDPVGFAVVCPLADETSFKQQIDKLIAHFDLEVEDVEKDGLSIRHARSTTPFCFAVADGLLIAAESADTVAEIAKQASTDKGRARPGNENLRACYEALGDPNHFAVLLDIERLFKSAPVVALGAGPALAPLLAQGYIGMAGTVEEKIAHIELHWSFRNAGAERRRPGAESSKLAAPGGEEVLVTVVKALAASVAAARRQAQQAISTANMRGIGQMLNAYAGGHKGAFPESLEELVKAMPDSLPLATFVSPYDGRGPQSLDELTRKSYLVYRSGPMTTSDPRQVILAEKEVHGGGANFLFVDGHVEFIPDPRASELLGLIAGGAADVRP